MKFIPIDKARGLEIDVPVYILDDEGNYGYGRLIEEKKTSQGISREFEVLQFDESKPMVYKKNITHVCIPK